MGFLQDILYVFLKSNARSTNSAIDRLERKVRNSNSPRKEEALDKINNGRRDFDESCEKMEEWHENYEAREEERRRNNDE